MLTSVREARVRARVSYEVTRAGERHDVLETAYFVTGAELAKYSEEERVYDRDEQGHRRLRVYPKGSFVYRLAGRDRVKSASYYTPESLTKTVVKYALKELIPEEMPADEILRLTVCEPAVGSAAFVNEAVHQLAERYLARKQRELGVRIAHEQYARELQKVKLYIADRNVYGVDLNPVAVELAEISLWLNTVHAEARVPWFGYQLVCGNSLVGARRQVFRAEHLGRPHRGAPIWLEQVPERVPLGPAEASARGRASHDQDEPLHARADAAAPMGAAPSPRLETPAPLGAAPSPRREAEPALTIRPRPPGTVYHFLVADRGMADFGDKVVKALVPESIRAIDRWRKDFTREHTPEEIELPLEYSDHADELWAAHTRQLARDHRETEDTLPVWGQPPAARERRTTSAWKDRIRAQGSSSRARGIRAPTGA